MAWLAHDKLAIRISGRVLEQHTGPMLRATQWLSSSPQPGWLLQCRPSWIGRSPTCSFRIRSHRRRCTSSCSHPQVVRITSCLVPSRREELVSGRPTGANGRPLGPRLGADAQQWSRAEGADKGPPPHLSARRGCVSSAVGSPRTATAGHGPDLSWECRLFLRRRLPVG